MIKSIHFRNFKALRDATLPLGAFTLILGPNGSGKSTAMQALRFASDPGSYDFDNIVTAGWEGDPTVDVSIEWTWEGEKSTTSSHLMFKRPAGPTPLRDVHTGRLWSASPARTAIHRATSAISQRPVRPPTACA